MKRLKRLVCQSGIGVFLAALWCSSALGAAKTSTPAPKAPVQLQNVIWTERVSFRYKPPPPPLSRKPAPKSAAKKPVSRAGRLVVGD